MKVVTPHSNWDAIWWASSAPGPVFQSHTMIIGSTKGAVGGSFDRTLMCCVELMKAIGSNAQDRVLAWFQGELSCAQMLPIVDRLCNAYQATPCHLSKSFRGLREQRDLWSALAMYAVPNDFVKIFGDDGEIWSHGVFAVGVDEGVVDEWLQLSQDCLNADHLLEKCVALIWTDPDWEEMGIACPSSKVDIARRIIESS